MYVYMVLLLHTFIDLFMTFYSFFHNFYLFIFIY